MVPRSLLASLLLLSASALGYEILLMRLFSIIQWHHFAYMVIGLALLGYGISGTLVSLAQRPLLRHFSLAYLGCILLFATSSIGGFLLAQRIPLNAETILWDATQWLYLGQIFLLLALPFLFAATAVCLLLMRYPEQTGRIYAVDLLGAGAGSLLIVWLLFHWMPIHLLSGIGLAVLLAGLLVLPQLGGAPRRVAGLVLLIIGASIGLASAHLQLRPSPYKSLSQMLLIDGAQIVAETSSPLGLLQAVKNDVIPLRHAPGLSLNAIQPILPQQAIFTDGGAMTAVTRFPEDLRELAYLDQMPSALPYHIRKPESVLIIGAAGGGDVLQSLYHEVADIHALELNPQMVGLVDRTLAPYSGSPYSRPGVRLQLREARDYLSSSDRRFSLIQISLMDAFNAASSGLHALHESYLYTTEAIALYLSRVEQGGYLALTRWVNLPPRDSLKLLNTVRMTLLAQGVKNPAARIVLIRGWQTSTLLVKHGEFSADELARVRRFCNQRSFDLGWMPGLQLDETNRFNRLASPMYYQAASALFSDRAEDFIESYKFDLRPASDDRPYFHHFFRWSSFAELFELRDRGAMPLMEWGYLILWATLAIALLFSLVLILLPLLFYRQEAHGAAPVYRRDTFAYFFAIGLAFLMLEIAFIQKFTLLLHHPTYSISVSLAAFLVFAGLGSLLSHSLCSKLGKLRCLRGALITIAVISLLYLWLLPPLFAAIAHWSMPARILLAILLVAPLALPMGLPFPLALSALNHAMPRWTPWAWGINGCASVVSASLATILAIHFGFNAVVMIALLLYLCAMLFFPRARRG